MSFEVEMEFSGRRYKDVMRGMKALSSSIDRNVKSFPPIVRKELQHMLDITVQVMLARHSASWHWGQKLPTGPEAGRMARRRTRTLVGTLRGQTKITNGEVRGMMRGDDRLLLHEKGGTVRPTRSQYLTIPLQAALNKNGVPLRKSARGWKNTFVRRSRGGKLIIFQRRGQRIVPLYVLKKSVTIPRRLGLSRTLQKEAIPFVGRLMERLEVEFRKG